MDVVLVGAELEENLALRYLACSLQAAGHRPHFATFNHAGDTEGVIEQVARAKPGLVGMSMTFQFRAKEFGALATDLRDAGYRGHITAGGHFPTFAHRECLDAFPAIDSIVRHEGEHAIVEMSRVIERGGRPQDFAGILGLVYRAEDGAIRVNDPRPLTSDLDSLPFPARVGPPPFHLGIPAAFLVGTRGCFGHCTFCCIHAYLKSAGGNAYRWRSPGNVADEMAALRRERGVRMFVFHDDDFFTRDHERDHARMVLLRDGLKARGVSDIAIVVKARPDDVDPRVFSVLREIGLLRVYLGVEAGSTQGLRTLGRGVDLGTNRRALELLRASDVYTCFNMLVFDPESTLESLRESFSFLREYASVPMNFCRTEIYVGTPLMAKLAREDRLIGDVFGWDYRIRDPRAERSFRVFAKAFLDRNFRCDGLMNSTLGLGYHLHLLRTFYPRAMTPELRALALETTRAVNLDCNARMADILDFAESKASEDAAAFDDFTAKTTEEVERASAALECRVQEATSAIVRAATSPKAARPTRTTSRWGALSAATLALAPLAACDRTAPPPPPDPLPVPTLVSGPPDVTSVPLTTASSVPLPPPPDPLPPPTVVPVGPRPVGFADAGSRPRGDTSRPLPPPDPVPRPTVYPMPPDPPPPPHTAPTR